MTVVLILGSGPNVIDARDWDRAPFDRIVAINNAWRVRSDWDDLIHPDDFPEDRWPENLENGQRIIRAAEYVPHQNTFGGFVYAGGTMAFTASYWALAALKPKTIAVMGCDMVYSNAAKTHFYGKGTADPLREDVTLRSLEAKSARLMALAAREGCAMVNLSQDDSRLVFPRATPDTVAEVAPAPVDHTLMEAALQREAQLGYYVPSGKYWKEEARFATDVIDELDRLWLRTVRP
ncbi:hypothetical protein [Yoonia litorea]|uniref:Uncharacterized protein n=1 Tax=Yoonia litorea TaxID=1123755 RepID=A0A1I6L9N0_9RHOB|nr:hypothetical protein [Yoonia litorea]SFS00169.1 hypothetical protein SAMN05444714_0327 [Yoonia litorea]